MLLDELRLKFVTCKGYEPMEENELLDYARQLYLKGELMLFQYRQLVKGLELNGATLPQFLEVN
ncbi:MULTISPECIES: YppF family protein [Bacillus]|uniref:YppF family protein n=1 Tax=Bacillus TaxID=1386 RepID=UPI000BB74A06|nr:MULTISPECIES: YppF family protein [Bacillus]